MFSFKITRQNSRSNRSSTAATLNQNAQARHLSTDDLGMVTGGCFVKSWSTSGDADDRPTEEVSLFIPALFRR